MAPASRLQPILLWAASGFASVVPPDRATTWNPGIPGGVPSRTTVCETLQPGQFQNGALDAAAGIQEAIDRCPVGQVVLLKSGDYMVNSPLFLRKGVVLRGEGPRRTKIRMEPATTSGAPVIWMGTRWFKFSPQIDLATDAVKGGNSVTLVQDPGLKVGEIVAIDQLTDTNTTRWSPHSPPGDVSRTWFTRPDRPMGQILEIASISGTTITFTTPFHTGFATALKAQLSRIAQNVGDPPAPTVKYAGVEDLYVTGGGNGNITMANTAYSWIRNVESDNHEGSAIGIDACFRSVVRDSYIHSTANPTPGGGGYGISFSWYAADNLLENNISWNMNKVMVMRASGGGNVIGYNYFDDGWIRYNPDWVEVGANASHMTCPHFELFEGNEAFNFDGDNTWGNAVYITVFRNHFSGRRRSAAPLALTNAQNPRAVGLMEGHWWYTFAGNVLGSPDLKADPATGFREQAAFPWDQTLPMWKLGYNPEDWDAPGDPKVLSTVIRHGNFDYVSNSVKWDPANPDHLLPPSLYLSSKPAFMSCRDWPWVQPESAVKVRSLPAKDRFEGVDPCPDAATDARQTRPAGLSAFLADGKVVLRFWQEKPGAVELAIFDLQGKRLGTPLSGPQDRGAHEVSWNPHPPFHTAGGGRVHLARLQREGEVSMVRFVR